MEHLPALEQAASQLLALQRSPEGWPISSHLHSLVGLTLAAGEIDNLLLWIRQEQNERQHPGLGKGLCESHGWQLGEQVVCLQAGARRDKESYFTTSSWDLLKGLGDEISIFLLPEAPGFRCYLESCVWWEAWSAPAQRSKQREKGPKTGVFSDVSRGYSGHQSQPLWLRVWLCKMNC